MAADIAMGKVYLDFPPPSGIVQLLKGGPMPHLSPPTLTLSEQKAILRATARNPRDHVIYSLALGTGLQLAEIVGLDAGDVYVDHKGTPRTRHTTPCRLSLFPLRHLLLLPRLSSRSKKKGITPLIYRSKVGRTSGRRTSFASGPFRPRLV